MADAPRGKYRIEEAPYLYLKANASGKGYGGEYFWNPYNLALRDKLQAEGYESSLAEDGGALTLLAGSKPLPGISELSIDFGNSRLQLEWGSGEGEQRCRRELEIPQKTGWTPLTEWNGRIKLYWTSCKRAMNCKIDEGDTAGYSAGVRKAL